MTHKNLFYLTEMLMVIAVVVILMSLINPALDKVIKNSNKVVCATNIKQIGVSLTQIISDDDDNYPKTTAHSIDDQLSDYDGRNLSDPEKNSWGLFRVPSRSNRMYQCPEDPLTDPGIPHWSGKVFENISYYLNFLRADHPHWALGVSGADLIKKVSISINTSQQPMPAQSIVLAEVRGKVAGFANYVNAFTHGGGLNNYINAGEYFHYETPIDPHHFLFGDFHFAAYTYGETTHGDGHFSYWDNLKE